MSDSQPGPSEPVETMSENFDQLPPGAEIPEDEERDDTIIGKALLASVVVIAVVVGLVGLGVLGVYLSGKWGEQEVIAADMEHKLGVANEHLPPGVAQDLAEKWGTTAANVRKVRQRAHQKLRERLAHLFN